jgi:hypothetical protein
VILFFENEKKKQKQKQKNYDKLPQYRFGF